MIINTEFGYLTVGIIGLKSVHKIHSQTPCDSFGDSSARHSNCDPYVSLYIREQNVLESDKYAEQTEVYFFKMYQTPTKIREDTIINFSIWDADTFGADDLLLSVTTKPKLMKHGFQELREGENRLWLISSWTRCYKDDICN